jgi:hypothetical protein
LGIPIPPETGKSFSGVITRTAAPTWISARTDGTPQSVAAQTHKTRHRRIRVNVSKKRFIILALPVFSSAIFPLGTLPPAASSFVVDPNDSGKEFGQSFQPDMASESGWKD